MTHSSGDPAGAPSDALAALAAAHGVAAGYRDWRDEQVSVPASTLVSVLAALDVDASDPDAALAAHRDRAWASMLPPYLVVRVGTGADASGTVVDVHVPHGAGVQLRIVGEDGSVLPAPRQVENWAPPREVDGALVGEASFALPADLPPGYHRLEARSEDRVAECLLIVTPSWLGLPERLGTRRHWGLAVQLYSVRSRRSWEVGDLGDLGELAGWAGHEHGASFVLVNPLHAAEPTAPMTPSPYLPTSRRFANPLYLRVERIPEFAYLSADVRSAIEHLAHAVRGAQRRDRIDRDAAWTAKAAALRLVHAHPLDPGREIAYRAFCRREGQPLDDFAVWCALSEYLASGYGADWQTWPAELQHPQSPAVARFAADYAERVDFHRWLQWQLDEQLADVQASARSAGLALGVIHDLAVGVNPAGADAWSLQDVYARGMRVGAPPDAYAQTGQDWEQPPWRPDRLAATAYAPFRQLVAAALRHSGGLRVDHIIGLFRLWWIPEGVAPTDGTYVRYDHEALIGILALEAARAGAVVIGEDLGTVEPWVRDYLRGRGILGTSVLWFEMDYAGDRSPLAPETWREYCLASVTTHDLPPSAGYLAGDHVRLRDQLGLLTRSVDEELAADRVDRDAWLALLHERGLVAADADVEQDVDDIVVALHQLLWATPSRLRCLALTDAVGERRTQNQPGTTDEYPNWRVPLGDPDGEPVGLEDVFASERAHRLAEAMRPLEDGPSGQSGM